MDDFVGRSRELAMLDDVLDGVKEGIEHRSPGKCLMLRGRRRVGKSALVEEFTRRSRLPTLFFTAAREVPGDELESFSEAVADSDLPVRAQYLEDPPATWSAALRLLADILPDDTPSLVVLDEVPYLMDRVDAFEGILQRAWDRQLSRKPVLLLLIGSDLSMMKALNSYDRPFHQRGTEMVLGPLNPAEIGQMLDLEPAAAFDAALVTGGLPLICADWRKGTGLWDFLERSLAKPLSALVVSARLMLAAEFPDQAMAEHVLRAIGSGERTFTNIARAAGGISHSTLSRALDLLVQKGIVASNLPVSMRTSKERRYTIDDPYLRFWLALVEPHLDEIERLRGDLVVNRIRASWTSWRGRAIEPLVRESLARMLPSQSIPYARKIGGYWTRSNDVEIDIVGADDAPVAKELLFVGSIKWLDNDRFDRRDLAALLKHRAALTGEDLPLVGVSRSGFDCEGLDGAFGPDDLIKGWQR
jgi:AAA+ ATPase superfamily predicted ATPase